MKFLVAFALALSSTVAMLALPAAVAAEPARACVAADVSRFNDVRPEGALPGFPGWSLETGFTNDRMPPTPTLVAVDGARACDLTHGLATFLGAAPGTPRDAVDQALLAIGATFVDVFPHATLASDAGIDARAPVVTPLAHGYAVDLTAWTPRNGVVADFHVVLDGAVQATFAVRDVAKGDAYWESEGWLLPRGATQDTLAPAAAASASTCANGDGSSWRINYNVASYASAAEADAYVAMTCRFAQEVYLNETGPWGFVDGDPDGVRDITLDGCDCIYGDINVNIHLFPRPNDILPLLPGLAYPDTEEHVGGLILGHEFFHHLQYSINQWRMGGWQVEGQARFSETVHRPATDFGPGTLLFRTDANGLNNYILHPNSGLGRSYGYEVSLVWGWLYKHDGGMAVIKRELVESVSGGTNPDTDGVATINRAIAAQSAHEHANFAEALDALAASLITHDGWTWGHADGSQARDWSTYFVPMPRVATTPGLAVGVKQGKVALNGMECVQARPGPSGAVAVATVGDADTSAALLTLSGGAWTAASAKPAGVAQAATDGVVCLARATRPVAGGPLPVTVPNPGATAGTYVVAVAAP